MGLLDGLLGGGGSNSKQSTSNVDNRVGASDNASVQVNAANSQTTNGLRLGNVAGGFQINTTDGGVVQAALNTVRDVVNSQANLSAASSSGLARAFDSASNRVAGLAETKITDGANLTNKTVTLALICIGGLVALFYFFRRS